MTVSVHRAERNQVKVAALGTLPAGRNFNDPANARQPAVINCSYGRERRAVGGASHGRTIDAPNA